MGKFYMDDNRRKWLAILVGIIGLPTIILMPSGYQYVALGCLILLDIIKNYDPEKKINVKKMLNPFGKTWVQNTWFIVAVAWILAIAFKAPSYILMLLCFVNVLFLLYNAYDRRRQ